MSATATLPASGDARTSTLARLTGVNVQQDRHGKAFIQFSDSYKFKDHPRTFRLVDMTAEREAARGAGKRLPQWDVYVVQQGGTPDSKPVAGAFEVTANDRNGKPHGRISFTDPYTHRRYVLFVYGEPQPTPGNPQVTFHGSASVDLSGGGTAVQGALSRFSGRPSVPVSQVSQVKQGDVETTDLDEPQGQDGEGQGSDDIPF
jgi:hypothetical protein